jgi:CheY-like chemotaxis protein
MILYVSSRQVSKTEEAYRQIIENQKEIEHKQNLFLSNITENIHEIVEHTYQEVVGQPKECFPPTVVEKEKQLMNVTSDLIEFLRLKSKKVKVTHEQFNLNNVLNEVAGSVSSKFHGSCVDLIFDIDNNIPRYLIGDVLHLEKSLHNLLAYVLRTVTKGMATLSIEMFKSIDNKIELHFRLSDTGDGLTKEEIEKLFVPVYDEVEKQYSGLGLFVAKELITLMEGEISVHSIKGKGTTFTVILPFEIYEPENRRNYRLPEKDLVKKKVFIVDSEYESALAIKKMFTYFKHDVKVMEKEVFLKKKVDLSGYDIVVLDIAIFGYRKIYNYLEQVKTKKGLKLVGLESLLQDPKYKKRYDAIDRYMSKPLSQERVLDLIVNLFSKSEKVSEPDVEQPKTDETQLPVYRGDIEEAAYITQQSFTDFGGKRLLIVEDDEINQKVLFNVLKFSNIDITFANNGRTAVNILVEDDKGFDMVLMDINMPVLDGYAATQLIRQKPEYDRLPIVAFTALALESEKEKIFKSGMNAYMTKPLNIGKLCSVFQMFMHHTEGSAVTHSQEEEKTVSISDMNNKPIHKEILDTESGIIYSNGNEGFYIEILKEFLDAYGESGELFAKLVREHRYEQMKMLCLDMKGLTGTIGAKEMYSFIVEVHHAILYRKEHMLEHYIPLYNEKLNRLKIEIVNYVEG